MLTLIVNESLTLHVLQDGVNKTFLTKSKYLNLLL